MEPGCLQVAPTGNLGQSLQGTNGRTQIYCLYLLKPKESDSISPGPAFADIHNPHKASRTQTLTTKYKPFEKAEVYVTIQKFKKN